MSEYIRPDDFFKLTLRHPNGDADVFPVNGKYDRIDFFPRLGAYIIKIYDDEAGLVCYYTDEEQARKLSEDGDLPMVERDFMYESEHEGYLRAQSTLLTDEMFGGFDETPDEPS